LTRRDKRGLAGLGCLLGAETTGGGLAGRRGLSALGLGFRGQTLVGHPDVDTAHIVWQRIDSFDQWWSVGSKIQRRDLVVESVLATSAAATHVRSRRSLG
jgi:hypothetical protein